MLPNARYGDVKEKPDFVLDKIEAVLTVVSLRSSKFKSKKEKNRKS